MASCGDDAAHAAFGVFYIALVSWDYVDMKVVNGLPGPMANVDADVIAIGIVFFFDYFLPGFDKPPELIALLVVNVKVVGEVAVGDDEKVTVVDRVSVPSCEAEFAGYHYPFRVLFTKSTGFLIRAHGKNRRKTRLD